QILGVQFLWGGSEKLSSRKRTAPITVAHAVPKLAFSFNLAIEPHCYLAAVAPNAAFEVQLPIYRMQYFVDILLVSALLTLWTL
ncbi:MAG: hypothetical protein ACRD4T_14110, partial [Candidatus Acidiferrales bacterium]